MSLFINQRTQIVAVMHIAHSIAIFKRLQRTGRLGARVSRQDTASFPPALAEIRA